MKKVLTITILLVYIGSIVIVNLLGLKIKEFDGTKYVESIKVTEVVLLDGTDKVIDPVYYYNYSGDAPWFEFGFVSAPEGKEYTLDPESLNKNPNTLKIEGIEILPENAAVKTVEIVFDQNTYRDSVYFDEKEKMFIFLQGNIDLEITIKSMDGSLVETKIYLSALYFG